MAIDTFFKRVLYYTFHALFLITPLVWTPKMSELFEFPKMIFVYFCTLLIATSWAVIMIVKKKKILKKTYLDIPIILFVSSQIISTVLSINTHTSFYGYYSRFHGGLLSTISYIVLFYAFVSFISKEESKKLLKSLLLGAVLSSLYAFMEHFGTSPSCAIIGSGWQADCWIQDVVLRVFGTFGQPNWLAAYLISIIFIPLALLFNKIGNFSFIKMVGKKQKPFKIEWSKTVPYFLFVLFFLVTLFTKSRSGLLGLGVGMGFFSVAVFLIFGNMKKASVFLLGTFMTLLVSYFLMGKGTLSSIDKYIFSAKQTQNNTENTQATQKIKVGTVLDTGGTESGDIRKIVWRGALEVFAHNPLFGTGVETFAYSYFNHRPVEHNLVSEWDFLYNKAHNEWLNFLSNSGAFGLGTYLSMMIVFTIWSIRQILDEKLTKKERLLVSSFLSGYASLAISNFFGFSTVVVGLLFFLFPAFLLILTGKIENVDDESSDHALSNKSSLLVFLALTLGMFLSYKVYSIYLADKAYASGKAANSQDNIQLSLSFLEKAISYQKNEPEYLNEFSKVAANAALSLYAQNHATAAAEIVSVSITASDKALKGNDVHISYYKNRARILANLGRYDPNLLKASEAVMKQAIQLSPTDPKLYFSLGLLQNEVRNIPESISNIQKSIELKPNYELARYTLGEMYVQLGEIEKAKIHFNYILEYISPKNTQVIKALDNI